MKLLTTAEVGDALGLKKSQVKRLCQPDGPLNATKYGRIFLVPQSAVDKMIAAGPRRRGLKKGQKINRKKKIENSSETT